MSTVLDPVANPRQTRCVPEPLEPETSAPLVESPRAAFSFAWGMAAVLMALFILLGGTVQALHVPYGIWFAELFLFLGLTWMALRLSGRHPLNYPGLGVPPPSALALGFAAGAFNFFAVVIPLQVLSQAAFRAMGADELLEFFRGSKIFERQRPVDLAVIIAGVTLAAPLCEEYFFRGVLLRGSLSSGMKTWTALFVTSVFFSFFHLEPVGFLARAELGLLFGYLYLRTGSIWPAILAHSANNAVSTALFFIGSAAEGGAAADAELPLTQLPLLLLVFGGPLYLTLRWFQGREPVIQTGTVFIPRGLRLKEVWVWLGTAAVSAALLVAVDGRTVALNAIDFAYAAREPGAKDPAQLKAQFEALEETRTAVQRGEAPLSQYTEGRKRYRDQAKQALPPVPAPVPPLPAE